MNQPKSISAQQRFARLEPIRGFSCLYVIFVHAFDGMARQSGFLRIATAFGQEAVIVFFILSGFVFGWSATTEGRGRDRWLKYVLKRVVRIYTVWVPVVAAKMVIDGIEKKAFVVDPLETWIGNLFMLQDLKELKPAVICPPLQHSGVLWSLHYEWWFYMALPLVCLVKGTRRQLHAVGATAVLNSGVYAVLPNPLSRLAMYLTIWWVGVHAASVLRIRNAIHLKDLAVPLCYCAATAVPGLCIAYVSWVRGLHIAPGIHPLLESRHLLAPLVLVPLFFAWRRVRWVGFRQLLGWCTVAAPISYSLYLMHGRGFITAHYLSVVGNPVLERILYVIITLAFCWSVEAMLYPAMKRQAGL